MNPVEIEEAVSNLALEPFDRAEFPFQFLAAFDNPETTIKRLRSGSTNQSDIPGGVLQRSNIHLAVCASGEVDTTLAALRESPKTTSAKAKFILATDGEAFQAEDLNGGGTVACSYAEFPDHFGFFLPLAGITPVKEIQESSFDVKATGRLNRLYVQLLKENPDWATPARQHDMNHFMARLIFCFFAEDTDILLDEGLFTRTVEQMTAGDAASTHAVIGEIFRAMDTKPEDREAAGLPRYATKFPYVNGQLFSGSTEVPRFSKVARSYLMHIGSLNWRKINPDIFGSMIQAVTDDEERGSLGMHYTSVPNILKVLNPLFLDDLREKLEEAGDNTRKLLNLRNRMARIRVFDPACGSGNFLVIAYKEMRAIEAEINRRRAEPDRRTDIPKTNFRGIELRDFPAEIARLALIIAEYQCDVTYRGQKEAVADFLPLGSENWITCGNALQLDWLSICPPTGTGVKVTSDDLFQTPLDQAEIDFDNEGGETFLCSNPPYLGSVNQTREQKGDMERVLGGRLASFKDLDYVSCWFVKSSDFIIRTMARVSIVSTNSICQGEQVAMLWPWIFSRGVHINFAHTSFRWSNNASNNAGVSCVVVGLGLQRGGRIYDHGTSRSVESISPYLVAGEPVIVEKRSKPLSDLPAMHTGNSASDGGNLILSTTEKRLFQKEEPLYASKFLRKLVGSEELINGRQRFCLWIDDDSAGAANASPTISERVGRVIEVRRKSRGSQAISAARTPHAFAFRSHKSGLSIGVPKVSSERRPYITCDLFGDSSILSDLLRVIYNAEVWNVGILSSTIHRVWISNVCGRLENRTRYSNTIGWNTFPLPRLTSQNKADLTRCAENILLAREAHFPATIADLYDPEAMPEDLRRAHEANDEVLERIYIGRRFRNDTERLEKLFELYTQMTTKPGGPRKAAA
jgi:hypothetical protein